MPANLNLNVKNYFSDLIFHPNHAATSKERKSAKIISIVSGILTVGILPAVVGIGWAVRYGIKQINNEGRIKVGGAAPNFTLPTQNGEEITLKNLLKKGPVVLYFYPKDDTTGCTAQACTFRDAYQDFKDAGAEVIGISSQSVESHQAFAKKNRLPFILASDDHGKVRDLFGVPKTMGMFPGRVTYVIDQQGVVRYVFNSQMGYDKHAKKALEALEAGKKLK